ncbi:hypothetical protein L1S34_13695 [Flavobacterium sp. K77]|nr:hypothetical protein [Flavobacterium sp. K77]MCF6142345.1 hypothetical protein [Flavobacterium sp. K77]
MKNTDQNSGTNSGNSSKLGAASRGNSNPNYQSKTGNPSGPSRGNTPKR